MYLIALLAFLAMCDFPDDGPAERSAKIDRQRERAARRKAWWNRGVDRLRQKAEVDRARAQLHALRKSGGR